MALWLFRGEHGHAAHRFVTLAGRQQASWYIDEWEYLLLIARKQKAASIDQCSQEGSGDIIRIDFLFIFPRALRWFRTLEPLVSKLPLGAQYQVLCRKPFTMPPAALFR